ncbi:MAG: surface antigen [Myxococcales bacterium]|nr:surface antigen [Myxococcales bacterium]
MFIAALASACAHRDDVSRPWVRHLVLHGVQHVNEADLRSHLVTEASGRLTLMHRRPFDAFALRLDAGRIEQYYRAHGFFDARVRSTDVNPADKPNAVNVEIFVDEGAVTRIESLKVAGLDQIGDDARGIIKNLDLRKGQIFDHDRYLDEKGEMRQRLKTLGYAWAEVEGDIVVNRDRHLADVKLKVDAGARATIRNVDVAGAFEVDRRLLVGHSLLRPGQPLTTDTIETARAKLYNLGFLSTVRIDYKHNLVHPEQADVLIGVTEGAFNEWRIGAGLSLELSRSDLRARAEYTRHNFLGGLRRLRVRAEPAWVFIPALWQPQKSGPAATVEVELTQLDVGLPPDEVRAVAGYDLGVEYAFQYYGPRAQIGYTRNFFHDRLQLGAAYDFQFLQFFNVDPALLEDPAKSARDYGFIDPYRLGWIDESLVLDLRDQPLDARRGGWFGLRAEEGGVWSGGNFTYEKVTAEVRGYYSIWRRITVAARTEFGHLFSQGTYGSPTTRRFYLGGPESHRGFNFSRLSVQIPSGIAGNPSLPIGGDEMFLTQLELRVRAVRFYGTWLEVAAFLDAGDVAAPGGMPHDHIDLGQLHVATGAGLRFKTVVGTIRADIGVRVNRLSDMQPDGRQNPDPHQPVAFHLSIGEPF